MIYNLKIRLKLFIVIVAIFGRNSHINLRKIIFLSLTVFGAKYEKYNSCKSLKYGYNYFGSKKLVSRKNAKNDPESKMVPIGVIL